MSSALPVFASAFENAMAVPIPLARALSAGGTFQCKEYLAPVLLIPKIHTGMATICNPIPQKNLNLHSPNLPGMTLTLTLCEAGSCLPHGIVAWKIVGYECNWRGHQDHEQCNEERPHVRDRN